MKASVKREYVRPARSAIIEFIVACIASGATLLALVNLTHEALPALLCGGALMVVGAGMIIHRLHWPAGLGLICIPTLIVIALISIETLPGLP